MSASTHGKPVQLAPEEVRVLVKLWLRGDVYRRLMTVAAARGLEVGELLEAQATRSVTPPQPHAKRWQRMTPERLNEAIRLLSEGKRQGEIADAIGVSQASVSRHLANLGLNARNS